MKHIIYLIAIIVLFTACKQNVSNEAATEVTTTPVVVDTAAVSVQQQTQVAEETKKDNSDDNGNTVKEKDAQIPKDGIYTYKLFSAEFNNVVGDCSVEIKNNEIKIILLTDGLAGSRGHVLTSGSIMKHIKTGKWIISNKKNDIYAEEIGGCSDGPEEIDFTRKIYFIC